MVGPPGHNADERDRAWFQVETFSRCLVVSVGGEVDVHNAAQLDGVLKSSAYRSPFLVIDLSGVTFIDSSGIGVLIRARKRAEASGDAMYLVHPPNAVRRILHGTHLDASFTIFDTLDEALGHASRSTTSH